MSNGRDFFGKQQRVLEDTSEAKQGISALSLVQFLGQLKDEELAEAKLYVVTYPSFKGRPLIKKVTVEYGQERGDKGAW